MSVGEVLWRVQVERTKMQWRAHGLPEPVRTLFERRRQEPFYGLPLSPARLQELAGPDAVSATLREAELILQGRWNFFAFAQDPTPATPGGMTDWHRCEATGRRADPDAFGPTLNYRDPTEVGDVKTIWEKSRHHHTTLLAVAYALTGDHRYAAGAVARVADWILENPPLRGINWASGLEVGLRLVSWAWVYELLRPHPDWSGWFGPDSPLWPSVYQHQTFLEGFESRGSSANNHLLGELTGLYVASVTWPVFEESGRWQRAAKDALTREATLQFFESGVNREMGFGYHVFATELLLHCALLGEKIGDAFDPAVMARLARAIRVIGQLRGPGDLLPRYGDDDEGRAAQLEARESPRVDGLLRVGRDWLGVPVPEPGGGHLSAALLLGEHRDAPAFGVAPAPAVAFPDAGLYLLRSGQGARELRVLADAGPLGYLSLAGHGHADALGFTLDVGPQSVVVDPGVYAYHADPEWRRYFRSTAAHNTLEIDLQDQSVQAGAFLWSHKASAAAREWRPLPDGGLLRASHDGYTRLPGHPEHTRELDLRGPFLTVTDQVAGLGRHHLRLHLHLHPDCEVQPESRTAWWVTWATGAMRVTFDPRLQVRCGQGEHDPASGATPLGWYSPRYGQKVPSPTFRAALTATLPVTLVTTLEVL